MVKFIIVRIIQAIPTLFVIATLTFFMTRLAPGGPFDSEKNIPDEIKEKLEAHFGLDKPLPGSWAVQEFLESIEISGDI